MIRKASIMKLKPGFHEEYKLRHDDLWTEMGEMLKAHGSNNYSIFLCEATDTLFAYVEIESEELWGEVASTDICQKWWAYMRDIMEVNDDNSPVSTPLKEVFYLA